MTAFLTDAVLKRDVFSETQKGHLAVDPATPVIRRIVTASPWWSRPLAWWLAKREIGALRALTGLKGTPRLIETDANGLLRTWTEGTPLHLARPSDPAWYRDAHRLLRSFRRRNLTHNDLAKPQNWLMSPDGRACVIDFQLASVHSKRGWLFKAMAYEDFRHLLKQRRSFAPQLMTPTAKRILKRRSLPSRIWMNTGKKLYNLVTRGIFNWSDGEGTGDRIDREGAAITSALKARPSVRDVALVPFPLPSKGTGIYAFIEGDGPEAAPKGADLVQVVARLPRRADGSVRSDLLQLVAMNQMTELDRAFEGDPELAALMRPVIDGRLNFTDRRISSLEAKAS
ncbi:serine/threonine protein kinase [Mesorhizobium sp. RP14(2022)]|uniref:Serine/threonine protein kinase n=1 Tax=Mesorhizobium liriopis TaxID=2953882 RepID=A0ABT1C5C5_9HYPH|nr:serine/threonine protein kinase [Mesorhizobium liriopis]MCO6050019.1 serine/threonine protein kinase [Mesorhizobium liriopis]